MMRAFIGTSGFAYPQWRGTFYPADTTDEQFLSTYAGLLASVELNATFYRMPKREVVATWASRVPDDFRFAVKASRRISHQAKLAGDEARSSMAYLWQVLEPMGAKLGPVLIQLSPYQRRDDARLAAFLADTVPAGRQVAFEFQHKSWDDPAIDLLLEAHGAVRCWADKDDGSLGGEPRWREWAYVRLRREDYSDVELEAWQHRLQHAGVTTAYVFFKHEDTATGALAARRFAARFAT